MRNNDHLKQLLRLALDEDIGSGDITTEAIIPANETSEARIIAKQDLVVAGIEIAEKIFKAIDSKIKFEIQTDEGDEADEGDVLATLSGKTRAMLTGERTALNFLQHLSGIATFTKMFSEAVANTRVKILDTRKTTPGYRALEKHAVRMGDGENHRIGLYDRYLIKDNHIDAAGGISAAVELAKKHRKNDAIIEVEARNLDEVSEAIKAGADIIMLDNMSPASVKEAVKAAKGKAKLEISGNITLDNILKYAKLGADFISVGALTHSAPAADICMKLEGR